ncbi:hypothetical protein [Bremerella sp.]|uniref:hypothetical protein n=1 Tax=Bremerella sp. TaxID=2795602 RepID=UPI00391B7704
MSSHHPASQPEKQGDGHSGQAPQVAVRDGNRLLCPCCGEVLMVLPEEPLNQVTSKKFNPPKFDPPKIDQRSKVKRISCPTLDAIIARQEAEEEAAFQASMAPKEPVEVSPASPVEPEGPRYQADPIVVPIDPDIAAYEFPEHDPPPPPKRTRHRTPKTPIFKPRPKMPRMADMFDRKPKRDRQPRRKERPLVDPWSHRSARIYAWMYYRMQKLNVQLIGEICAKQEAIEQLTNDLTGTTEERTTKQELRVPRPSPLGRANQVPVPSTSETQPTIELNPHAHADVGMAPDAVAGSTSNVVPRHAQEDLGVAPVVRDANERGPP